MSELAVGALADRPWLKDLTHQRQTSSLVQTEKDRRTVRAQGADYPPFNLENHQRPKHLWYNFSNSRRTVRAPEHQPNQWNILSGTFWVRVVDRPPTWAGLSASQIYFPPDSYMLSGTGADCPHIGSQHSNLIFSNFFKTSLALMHASRHFEQNGTKDLSTTSTRPLLIARLSIQKSGYFSSTNRLVTGKMQKPYLIHLPWARALHIISKMSYDHNQNPFIYGSTYAYYLKWNRYSTKCCH